MSVMKQVTIRIPASTSNLGPGFDCLGIALQIYNEVTVARGKRSPSDPMIAAAAAVFFAGAEMKPFPFACSIRGEVPIARGLGSSVTVRLGVMHGLNELSERPLRREQIFRLCASHECHPDNATPASLGGFNVVRADQRHEFSISARLYFVLWVPDFKVKTGAARRLLPARVGRAAAVENCGNAAAITAAFASREYQKLRGCFTDHLHQPFRKKLVPHFDRIVAAAEEVGALGAFLSGSGSTVAAITLRSPETVSAAMRQAAGPANASVLITTADNRGARIVATEGSR
ncbi:MAG: homoserine kinase [Chthoniobacterales bacterium]